MDADVCWCECDFVVDVFLCVSLDGLCHFVWGMRLFFLNNYVFLMTLQSRTSISKFITALLDYF